LLGAQFLTETGRGNSGTPSLQPRLKIGLSCMAPFDTDVEDWFELRQQATAYSSVCAARHIYAVKQRETFRVSKTAKRDTRYHHAYTVLLAYQQHCRGRRMPSKTTATSLCMPENFTSNKARPPFFLPVGAANKLSESWTTSS
jgi:hypothetical protein